MRRIAAAVLGLACMAGTALAAGDPRVLATAEQRRLVVGIDLSKSNPLITDQGFATKVSQRVADSIRRLGFASEVHIRTLGAYDVTANSFYFDATISARSRPATVAAEVAKLISGTPLLVKKGVWKSQSKTNVLAFLDNALHAFGCGGQKTDFVLLTDGIEDSEYAQLAKANAKLPEPAGVLYRGCASLTILGLGQGQKSPVKTAQLRDVWQHWAAAAGFGSFTGLNDW